MNLNSENPRVGKSFQEKVSKILENHFEVSFDIEVPIQIGSPLKNHRFDCVSEDKKIIAECKCYTWTETGNIPSAKMGFLNEAVFYMSYLPEESKKIIVMKKAMHPKRRESLGEYYLRTNNHLLEGISLFEVDTESNKITVLK